MGVLDLEEQLPPPVLASEAKPNAVTLLPACVSFRKLVAAVSQKQW